MPESNEPTTPQAGEAQAPQTPPATSAPAAAQETPQAGTPTEESISLREAKKLRKEAKALRERLAETEDKAKKLETEKMTDAERVAARAKELEAENAKLKSSHRTAVTHYAVALEAQKFGVVDPEVAARLIPSADIEYGEDGLPTNVSELVKQLVEDKPYLRVATATPPTTPPSSGAPTNPPTQSPSNPNSPGAGSIDGNFEKYLKMDKGKLWEDIRAGRYSE